MILAGHHDQPRDRRHETGHSRDVDAVLEARYWLTDKAYDVLAQLEATRKETR